MVYMHFSSTLMLYYLRSTVLLNLDGTNLVDDGIQG